MPNWQEGATPADAQPCPALHAQPAPARPPCWLSHAILPLDLPQISVFEMARILANMLDGGSEEKLFFGGAGQFIGRMADVSGCIWWNLRDLWRGEVYCTGAAD